MRGVGGSQGRSVATTPATAAIRGFGAARFPHVRSYASFSRILVLIATLTAAVVLLGYLTSTPALYRGVPGGPGTHPLSLLGIIALIAGFLYRNPTRRIVPAATLAFALAIGLAVVQMVAVVMDDGRILAVFGGLVADEWTTARPVVTGWNTALTILSIGLTQLLRVRFAALALLFLFFSPLAPVISLVGYSYRIDHYYGEMSIPTTVMLGALALAQVSCFFRSPVVRPFFADTMIGRLARFQLLGGVVLPWLVGLVVSLLPNGMRLAGEALVVAAMIWIVLAMVVLATMAHHQTDRVRRGIERNLRESSVTDRLTGVSNRHGATLGMRDTLGAGPVGVILVDLDHFKAINDSFGHAVGDRVLVQAALAMRAELRQGDLLARWGGEEFLAVLPGARVDETITAAERLRAALATIKGPSGEMGAVTGSFGVSMRGVGEATLDAAILRADDALYRAKGAGRNRVVSDVVEPYQAIAAARQLAARSDGPRIRTPQGGSVSKA